MSESLLVSIIVNNYNYDRFLAEAIDSALNQTYSHTEVIVVDDGSSDNSRNIIAGYGDRIVSILQENGKQGKAFNSGFAASRGEIAIFLDSDDFLFSQAVERVVAVWKPTLAKVHYRLAVVDTDGQTLGYSLPQGGMLLSTGNVWTAMLEGGGYVSTPTSGNALNRKAAESLFPIHEEYKLTADDYLSTLIPFHGDVAAVEEPLGVYRIHTNNQWALATVTGAHFRRFLHHDSVVQSLLVCKAKEIGYKLPEDFELRSLGRFQVRLISLRLDPKNHQYPSDNALQLIYLGQGCLWKYSPHNWQKRLIYSLWFLWVGLMPLPLAKTAIAWLYAPQKRPKAIDWVLTRMQTLVS